MPTCSQSQKDFLFVFYWLYVGFLFHKYFLNWYLYLIIAFPIATQTGMYGRYPQCLIPPHLNQYKDIPPPVSKPQKSE